jgi:hypothetical protein
MTISPFHLSSSKGYPRFQAPCSIINNVNVALQSVDGPTRAHIGTSLLAARLHFPRPFPNPPWIYYRNVRHLVDNWYSTFGTY